VLENHNKDAEIATRKNPIKNPHYIPPPTEPVDTTTTQPETSKTALIKGSSD
jgi:hypothetical protein